MKYILLLFFYTSSLCAMANPMDSLRTEKIDGKFFIIHQVDSKETLFSLARRYNVSVDDIKKNNPIVLSGLKIGDVIRIPFFTTSVSVGNKHIVAAGETLFSISRSYGVNVEDLKSTNDLQSNDLIIGQELTIPKTTNHTSLNIHQVKLTLPDTATYQYHIVMQGETLFSLSRKYQQEVSKLQEWNMLLNNNISLGDSLIVSYSPNITKTDTTTTTMKIVEPPKSDEATNEPKPLEKEKITASTEENVKITQEIVTNAANYDEMVETGLAELIEDSGDTRKYLALHRTAKIGTIIRVHNEMNGQEVFVRVLGKLPDTGINDKVLIKISKAAFDRLSAIDRRFRVRISYFPD